MAELYYFDGQKMVPVGGSGGGGGGTTNYNDLSNKPQINGHTLRGDQSAADLGLADYTDLSNKPKINGVTLSGNKTAADLGISGFAPVELWSHSATSGVDAGSYPLDVQGFKWFIVEFSTNTGSVPSTRKVYTLARLNTTAVGQAVYTSYTYSRTVNIAADGVLSAYSVTFSTGTRLSGTTTAESANYCVPTKIWGIG